MTKQEQVSVKNAIDAFNTGRYKTVRSSSLQTTALGDESTWTWITKWYRAKVIKQPVDVDFDAIWRRHPLWDPPMRRR